MLRHLLICTWATLVAMGICPISVDAKTFTSEDVRAVVPGAPVQATGWTTAGDPPVAMVIEDGVVLARVFSTFDITGSLGYSGRPIDILVGLDREGRITGARLLAHEEPILIIGVPHEDLAAYVSGFAGYNVTGVGDHVQSLPDAVSGATVSSGVIGDAIIRSARAVFAATSTTPDGAVGPGLDLVSFSEATWQDLVTNGSVVSLVITNEDVAIAIGDNVWVPPEGQDPSDLFIELHTGLATPPTVGQNLFGQRAFNRLMSGEDAGANMIFVAANGLYSFKGTGYGRSGVFDRIQIVQGNRTFRLLKSGYTNIERIEAAGAPRFREAAAFVLPLDTGFDPLRTWRLQLLATRETPDGGALGAVFNLTYQLPGHYRFGGGQETAREQAAGRPLWQEIWDTRRFEIIGLCVLLGLFSAMLIFQGALVRDARVYRAVRVTFLTVTLVWLGWIAGAQLSVVNIVTFSQSLLSGFDWTLFLLDPLAFILWGFVAVALLFWGRGVYCGWLCPFGALQELLNGVARRLKVPQITVPFGLHERLWPIKYVIFLGLFAVSLGSVELAFLGAEVEPFKTAISLGFVREWPFVAYAVALLAAGLFIERFYCRYLCPLGAALAIPARLRMFDWLKRRHQCGLECRICAVQCTVQAIHPEGHINPNECIHCLNCQRFYFDKTNCPPLIVKEKRRQRREAVAAKARQEADA